jgi:uncharacterized protein (DUF952 family)
VSEPILHVTTSAAWMAARKIGRYEAESLKGQGFIHCSKADQMLRVANLLYKGQNGLVLLVIEPQQLDSRLRWEPGEDLPDVLFPHVYGPINLDAVVEVLDFEPGPDGSFSLPVKLEG